MKKIIIFVVCIICVVLILFLVLSKEKTIQNYRNITEYTPEAEISEIQERMTVVTLYFVDPEKNEIVPEARNVDVKELMESPYEKILSYLMEGSTDSRIGKSISEGTKINSIKHENDSVFIDFNQDFLNNNLTQELVLKSIVYTFKELKEISNVIISVDGVEIYNDEAQEN